MKKYKHIVMFRLKAGAPEASVYEAISRLRGLGQNHAGLESWKINASIDTRKGSVIVEEGLFSSEEAFRRFQNSTQHQEVAEYFQKISDWWVGDYFEEL